MDFTTVKKVNEALRNILANIDYETCAIDAKYKNEYGEYFKTIEDAIICSSDKFFKEWIHEAQVRKNIE